MQLCRTAALVAIICWFGAVAQASIGLPFTEDFSSGSEGYNSTPASGSLSFNGFDYSVDGNGVIALYNVNPFIGPSTPFANIDGLGVIGDYTWTGDTSNNVHTFTVASGNGSAFALSSLDWATGNGGPPTIYTITGYRGLTQVAQIADIDLEAAGTYGSATSSEIFATDIGPGDGSAYGLNLVFSGSDWTNIDRFVFSATGNDILVVLDNIQYAPAAIPEPSVAAFAVGLAVLAVAGHRRFRRQPKPTTAG
ncbi:MAG: hypothetical protein JSS11_04695 [Verrucomicrobia bacterium]|nr:hypothetical protein [Verrucomicrobiota bacterium]